MNRSLRIRLSRPSQIVATELRARILRGELDDVNRLPPAAEFAAQLGVSRHHLREALRMLEQDGLVRIRRGHGGGISTAVPDAEVLARTFEGILVRQETLLADLMAARRILEPAAAQLAAESATDAEIEDLERLLAEHASLPAYEPQSNSEFHLAVVRAAHNDTLLLIMRSLQSLIQNIDSVCSTSMQKESLRAHRAIVRALKARDAEGVGYLVRLHLRGFEERLRESGIDPAACTIAGTPHTPAHPAASSPALAVRHEKTA